MLSQSIKICKVIFWMLLSWVFVSCSDNKINNVSNLSDNKEVCLNCEEDLIPEDPKSEANHSLSEIFTAHEGHHGITRDAEGNILHTKVDLEHLALEEDRLNLLDKQPLTENSISIVKEASEELAVTKSLPVRESVNFGNSFAQPLSASEIARLTNLVNSTIRPSIDEIYRVAMSDGFLTDQDFSIPGIISYFNNFKILIREIAINPNVVSLYDLRSILGTVHSLMYFATLNSSFYVYIVDDALVNNLITMANNIDQYGTQTGESRYFGIRALKILGHMLVNGSRKGIQPHIRANIFNYIYSIVNRRDRSDLFYAAIWTVNKYAFGLVQSWTGWSYQNWVDDKKRSMFPSPSYVRTGISYKLNCPSNLKASYCDRYASHLPAFEQSFLSLVGFDKFRVENNLNLMREKNIYVFSSDYEYKLFGCMFFINVCDLAYDKSGELPNSSGLYFWGADLLVTYNRPKDSTTQVVDNTFFHEISHLLEESYLFPTLAAGNSRSSFYKNTQWAMEGLADYSALRYFSTHNGVTDTSLLNSKIAQKYAAYAHSNGRFEKSLHELIWRSLVGYHESFGFSDYPLATTLMHVLHDRRSIVASHCLSSKGVAIQRQSTWATMFYSMKTDQNLLSSDPHTFHEQGYLNSEFHDILRCLKDDADLNNVYTSIVRSFPASL